MNISEFKENYPADLSLYELLLDRRERELKKERSLVVFLADKLAAAGGGGLKELIGTLEHSGINQPLCEKPYLSLPEETKQSIRMHHAAVITGVTINSLEQILVNRCFEIEDWCSRYNLAVSGTSICPTRVKKEFEEIDTELLKKMYRCVNEDKTFSLFFKFYTSRTPSVMAALLESSGALPYINAIIIPIFKERAKYLVISP